MKLRGLGVRGGCESGLASKEREQTTPHGEGTTRPGSWVGKMCDLSEDLKGSHVATCRDWGKMDVFRGPSSANNCVLVAACQAQGHITDFEHDLPWNR